MRQIVEVSGAHPSLSPDEAFAILRNFDEHVALSEVVRSVRVEPLEDGGRSSRWEISFRNGLLRWVQRDEFDEARREVRYTLLSGDPAELAGYWRIEPRGDGFAVRCRSAFDLGIATFSETLDPLAARILRETLTTQLSEIFGAEFEVDTMPVEA
jgi:hypothetical protein